MPALKQTQAPFPLIAYFQTHWEVHGRSGSNPPLLDPPGFYLLARALAHNTHCTHRLALERVLALGMHLDTLPQVGRREGSPTTSKARLFVQDYHSFFSYSQQASTQSMRRR